MQDITIDQIIDAVDEVIEMTRCGSVKDKGCMPDHAKCKTHDLWEGLSRHIRDYLAGISVADVMDGQPSKGHKVVL
jgi:Rrf2 family iron-sulfur cluster assembly transcriptional regulator